MEGELTMVDLLAGNGKEYDDDGDDGENRHLMEFDASLKRLQI